MGGQLQGISMPIAKGTAKRTAEGKIWLRRIALGLGLLLVVAGIGLALKNLMTGNTSPKKAATTIKIMSDTPPPPPPPPPKEPPKEQPKEMKVEQPKPQEAPQPPAEALKMEGAAGDGPSPFQAGTVTNEYQGGTTIGGKDPFSWFTGLLKGQIESALAKDRDLAKGDYRLVVKVWVAGNGKIERFELEGSSGNAQIDGLIKAALNNIAPLSEPPPANMPQPVRLRITSRSAGG
ncbi:outer membrane transport energization protein TonB [Nitrosospira sp. Nsp5]|uniref:Outer membrane transport energization protein TonB n=2 Tax=Nitrosospira TaxID=35798 RepID=A0ABY0T985_9PROT|nr:TonB C-terminal domain-containing protein [Nitrosospira multiformis]PTR08029.1 outer membrane transport energization protein TonB [Nitrosospira sp. Nsp5]SDQ47147.1 outer membrane transport energization protein TonB [Nitrosospira multiformis]